MITDPVLKWMHNNDEPISRERYIEFAYGILQEPWTAEQEAELPEALQDWSLFELVLGELVLKSTALGDYDPNQPREPKGSPHGGQWTSAGGQASLFGELPEHLSPAKKKEIEEIRKLQEEHEQEEAARAAAKAEAEEEFDSQHEIDSDNEYLEELRQRSLGEPPPLPSEQRDALELYTGPDYKGINEHLRFGVHIDSENAKHITNMDRAFERVNLAENMTVYRGVDADVFDEISGVAHGEIFQDKGFISTSIKNKVAEGFSYNYFEIDLPKGLPAIPLGYISQAQKEREVLLKRGTRFRVHKEGGRVRLEALR